MRKLQISLFILILLLSTPATAGAEIFNPHYLLSDEELGNINGLSLQEVQQFLQSKGSLGNYHTIDVDGVVRPASEIIWRNARTFGLNPQFLLVLLQREQSLVEDPKPTQKQLDWAMGYAICDDCSKNDPQLQKFKGFANQLYYAAERIRDSYLTDLDARGYTLSNVGPYRESLIDGRLVVPMNNATAVLYTYTPHLHGNENFVRIWNRWFAPNYPHGSLLQDATTGGVYLIQFGKKRPITSQAAFHSRFNEKNVIPVQSTVLDAYDTGAPIHFPNYSLLRSPDTTVYLLVDDTIRPIQNMEAFRQIGFNPDEILQVESQDLVDFSLGEPITAETAYPRGALIQNPENGGIFYVEAGVKHPIYAKEILAARYPDLPLLPGNAKELSNFATGSALLFPDGTLVAVPGSPDVFVISGGQRRHIVDETTFLELGWEWDRILWTNERAVLEHALGEPVILEHEELEPATDDPLDIASARN